MTPNLCLLAALRVLAPPAVDQALTVAGQDVTVAAGQWTAADQTVTLPAATIAVPAVPTVTVQGATIGKLPNFDAKAAGWKRGAALPALRAMECTVRFALVPESVAVTTADGAALVMGQDVQVDGEWGCLGRLPDGELPAGAAVRVDYTYHEGRLDSLVLAGGKVELRMGKPHVNLARPPALVDGEVVLAHVWQPVGSTGPSVLPILERAYPEPPRPEVSVAERLTPSAVAKLRSGELLKILAWGDSVTHGGYLPSPDDRWQMQLAAALKERFPMANIEVIHLGWGGRNTGSFLAEPPGSEFNYKEKVVASGADLIISEFVNDAGLKPEQVEERYSAFLKDFQGVNAEWIILTPHYVRPDWMGLPGETNIDDDPRPYVAGLRAFAPTHNVALADASLRWGRLWRQGIPYTTLLLNAINHPDRDGQKLFADAVMELMPAK